jgi:ADP-ribose pyrophosphatase YjhB (NUDIX family)
MMQDPTFKYCPVCATALVEKFIDHVSRSACPACNFILFLDPKLVVIVVVQHEGKLLLGRRNIEPGKGLWSFFGGYVDRGEKVEEAAMREVKEETNLDVQLGGLIGIYSERGSMHVLVVYQASIIDYQASTMAMQREEVSELAFFSLEELPTLAFSVDPRILHDWKKLNSQ